MKLKELIAVSKNVIYVYFVGDKLNCVVTLFPKNYIYDDEILSEKLLESDVVEIGSEREYSSIDVYIEEWKND